MKFIFITLLFLISISIYANEEVDNEVEVINLHESKSLDQMVLENLNEVEQIQEKVETSNELNETEINDVEVKQIEIIKDNFIFKNETKDLKNYLNNLKKINSNTLQKQIIKVLENLQLDIENDQHKEIFYLIVNYFKSIGQINKSYELIERYDVSEDKNFNFYIGVKLNYLLSTFQLNEACNFKEELNPNIKLDNFFFRDSRHILFSFK